jgi:protein phosphatase
MSWLRTAAVTDTGYLRATNQDFALATNDLVAVADGMGGHLGGEVAARIAVEELLVAYRRDRTTQGLIAAVRDANAAVYQRSKSDRNLRGMGTTLTAAAVVGDEPDGRARLALVNVGDSRAYLLDTPGQRIHRLTEDHSVVEEMVRSGELTADEAAVHPHRHILTRALGIEPHIETDCWELDLEIGSRLLLCSDGLTNELGEQEIAQILLDEVETEKAAAELVRSALQRGGIDNVTVVVLDVVSGEALTTDDHVIVIPVAVPGTKKPASGPESAVITEAIAVTPAVGAAASTSVAAQTAAATQAAATQASGSLAAGQGSSAVPSTATRSAKASIAPAGGAAGQARSRPMVLVPEARSPGYHRDRIITVRVVLFVLVFVAVLGGAAGVVVWFDKASFYVGLDRGYVTIFQGRPGGLLWFKPSVVERTTITPADLLASNVVYLRQGMEESSYQAARNLVHDLSMERTLMTPAAPVTTTTSPSGVTTTTFAGVATFPTSTNTSVPSPTTTSVPSPTTTTTGVPGTGTTTTSAPAAATTTTGPGG